MNKGFNKDVIKTFAFFKFSGIELITQCPDNRSDYYIKTTQNHKIISGRISLHLIHAAVKYLDFIDTPPAYPLRISKIPRRVLGLNLIPILGRQAAATIYAHKALPPDLVGVPFQQYIIADNYYQGYLHTQNTDLLASLTAILYNSKHPITDNAYQTGALFWFTSIKSYFASRWQYLFKPTTKSNTLAPPQNINPQESIDAMLRALTSGDVTKETQILNLDTHRALTELNAIAKESQEFNSKYKT